MTVLIHKCINFYGYNINGQLVLCCRECQATTDKLSLIRDGGITVSFVYDKSMIEKLVHHNA